MKLAIKFNQKAVKVVKCENDIKVGHRMEADGTKIAVRGGKVISRYHAPKTESKGIDGRPATQDGKLNQFRQAASEAIARKHKAARVHRAPSSAPSL